MADISLRGQGRVMLASGGRGQQHGNVKKVNLNQVD
jgi:hypothetical protein